VPEQTADEWLKGGDKAPLLISLDPSRRGVWEKKLAEGPRRTIKTEAKTADAPTPGPAAAAAPATPNESNEAPREPEKSQSQSSSLEKTPVASEQEPSKSTDPSLPALEDGETYASTSYKGRIMGKHIAEQLQSHKAAKNTGPLMVGLQGPQGCGECENDPAEIRQDNVVQCSSQLPPRSSAQSEDRRTLARWWVAIILS